MGRVRIRNALHSQRTSFSLNLISIIFSEITRSCAGHVSKFDFAEPRTRSTFIQLPLQLARGTTLSFLNVIGRRLGWPLSEAPYPLQMLSSPSAESTGSYDLSGTSVPSLPLRQLARQAQQRP
jgi:hypothetical protein